MNQEIVFSENPVTLIGGGAVYEQDVARALALAPMALCADGGADIAVSHGVQPAYVVGDFDSLSQETRARLSPQSLIQVNEQDSTDFEKAVQRISAPVILGVGFTGARLDHTLAVMHGMLRFAHKPVLLLAEQEVVLLAPQHLSLDLAAGEVVSLFPLVSNSGRSSGLKWPIDGLEMRAGDVIGTSNAALGGLVTLTFDQPGTILFLSKSRLPDAMRALLIAGSTHALWPAHG